MAPREKPLPALPRAEIQQGPPPSLVPLPLFQRRVIEAHKVKWSKGGQPNTIRETEALRQRLLTLESVREQREEAMASLKRENRKLYHEIGQQNKTIRKIAQALNTIFQEYLDITAPRRQSSSTATDSVGEIVQIYSHFSESDDSSL